MELVIKTLQQLLKSNIEQIQSAAQNSLGDCYYYGYGVKENQTQAVHWYQKAANQGNAIAQTELGYCYRHGTGIEQNLSQAVHWYLKAASQGYIHAKENLKQLLQAHTKCSGPKLVKLAMFLLGALKGKDISEAKLATCLGHTLSKYPDRATLKKHVGHFITTQAVMNNLIQRTGSSTHLSLLESQDSRQAFLALLEPGRLVFEAMPSERKGLIQKF